MAWLPWLAWAQLRATREPSVAGIGAAGLLGAAEIGTHNILAVFILPVCLALSLALSPLKRRFVLASAAASASGILLATGYWLPALIEAPLTHVKQLAGDWLPDHTFAPNHLLDGLFFAPFGPKVLKMTGFEAALVLGLMGLLLWRAAWSGRRLPELGLVGLMVVTLFGLTTWSVWLWMHAPLLGYIQFPWRLLILMGFLAAAMLALAASWQRWAWLGVAGIAVAIAIGSLAQVPDQRFLTPPPLDARTLQTQEYGSALDGVAIESEYQPQTSTPELMKGSQGKRLPDDSDSPAPVQVTGLMVGPTELHAEVIASKPSRIRLQTLLFPGWRATLDDRSWPLRPSSPAGFIQVDIPQGTHKLDVTYPGTTLEGAAGLVSGVALLGWLVWLLHRRRVALAALLALTVAGAVVLAHGAHPRALRPQTWAASPDQTLVAVDGPRVTGRGIELDAFWQYGAPHEANFDFVLRDADGREVRRTPAAQAATLPYEYVAANELLERRYTLTGPFNVPAGTYTLLAGAHELGQVALPAASGPAHTLDAAFGDKAALAGYSVGRLAAHLPSRAEVAVYPGDFLRVSLSWRSLATIDQNYVVFVHLIDGSGKSWASHDNQPHATLQATSSWTPGQTIADDYLLKLPDDLPPGMYRLETGMYHIDEHGYQFLPLAGGGNSVVFGTVKVRPRTAAPPVAAPVARWLDGITLDGWQQARQGASLALTFDWRAGAPLAADYTLFVHLSDPSGKVVGQADGPPQDGLYATHLWDVGDDVRDVHVLKGVPPGRYRLSIGWYQAYTGQRLALIGGRNELDLGDVQVG